MSNSGANHYMALYKDKAYRGLYEVHQVDELMRISKIHGAGPKGLIKIDACKYKKK